MKIEASTEEDRAKTWRMGRVNLGHRMQRIVSYESHDSAMPEGNNTCTLKLFKLFVFLLLPASFSASPAPLHSLSPLFSFSCSSSFLLSLSLLLLIFA